MTAPRRNFGAQQIAELDRDAVRRLVQLMAMNAGRIETYRPYADHDDWHLSVEVFWRERRVLIRVFYETVQQADVDRLVAADSGAPAEAALVALRGLGAGVAIPETVHLISAADLAARITRSPLVRWDSHQPSPALDRLELSMELDASAHVDTIGLRYLPSLALNEKPSELANSPLAPEVLLERWAFRVLTLVFRFGGHRLGENQRGQRLPDGLLRWPDASKRVALLDCKAASSGYVMDADHELRFIGYANNMRPELSAAGWNLTHLIVLSSSFPGTAGPRHPFHARYRALLDKASIRLTYLRADDLARTGALVMSQDMSPDDIERIDWAPVLDAGLVQQSHLDDAVARVSARS